MLEKDFEDVLSTYPELIEGGLEYLGRQVSIGGKHADLLFEDRFGQKLVVELKKGVIKREHIAQLMDYEGYFLSPDDPNVRVMLIGNRVPPNLRKSLDHHGFEWKEILESTLVEYLREKKDDRLLEKIVEEIHDSIRVNRNESRKEETESSTIQGGTRGVNQPADFEELKEFIQIKSTQVPSWFMDKLILENSTRTISQILEEDWWPYAERINDKHFPNISRVKSHLKYREERGWEYEYKGNPKDPIVRLVGFKR